MKGALKTLQGSLKFLIKKLTIKCGAKRLKLILAHSVPECGFEGLKYVVLSSCTNPVPAQVMMVLKIDI